MPFLMINPGTEDRSQATEANAMKIADRIVAEIPNVTLARMPARDDRAGGYFAFRAFRTDGKPSASVNLDIPGDDPDQFFESRPFVSRRMYVDGSSWLWGYAADIIESHLEPL